MVSPLLSGVEGQRRFSRRNGWLSVRPAVDALACELGVLQPSILAPPHALQDVVYHHEKITREDLLEAGIRPWQADFLAPAIAEALGQPAIG